jgi:ribonuclease Y
MRPETLLAVSAVSVLGWILALVVGAAIWEVVGRWLGRARRLAAQKEAEQIVAEARKQAEDIIKSGKLEAKEELIAKREEFEKEAAVIRQEFKATEKRLAKREDNLESKLDVLVSKEKSIEQSQQNIAHREEVLASKEHEIDAMLEEQRTSLLRITGMTLEEAKAHLLSHLEREYEHEVGQMMERLYTTAKEESEEKCRDVIITAIQRYAAQHTSEGTVSTVSIPSDDLKGRVIGREGRNIRAFEKATGVDVIVDDTPGVIVVSAFEPVRREVARRAMEKLIQDGRIHPARIEEVVAEMEQVMNKEITEIGKRASVEANIRGLHRKVNDLLGRLSFRTSYGQNVLRHSIEVAYLCQVMADELGLDGTLARRCGLLHDIGKAVDHEVEGAHPQIGHDICKRFNEKPEVLNAIAGHHGDVPAISPYTALVTAADAISASRPGGRRESLERYIKRLEQLEEIATSFDGVKQAYAIQAGREIRVIVDAGRVDDRGTVKIAHDIAKRVEEELTYPGEVRVTLLREVRAVEYAR